MKAWKNLIFPCNILGSLFLSHPVWNQLFIVKIHHNTKTWQWFVNVHECEMQKRESLNTHAFFCIFILVRERHLSCSFRRKYSGLWTRNWGVGLETIFVEQIPSTTTGNIVERLKRFEYDVFRKTRLKEFTICQTSSGTIPMKGGQLKPFVRWTKHVVAEGSCEVCFNLVNHTE